MARGHELGRSGEALAAELLERSGWTILERNFRFGHKEIDLVARRGRTVAFVEVKTRGGTNCGHPLDAVDGRKRAQVARVAHYWVQRHGRPADRYRFDAIAIRWEGGRPNVEHIEDAWRL